MIGLALLVVSAAALADAARVDVTRRGREFDIEAVARADAGIYVAWRTLTDYERLPQFVPGVHSARVLRRWQAGGVEHLVVEQRGEFRWLFYALPVAVRMDVVQRAPTRVDARAVTLPGDDAARLDDFEGRYELQPLASGVRVHYTARIVPRSALPPLFGSLAVEQTVRAQFDAMIAEIERRGRATPAPSSERSPHGRASVAPAQAGTQFPAPQIEPRPAPG